jgi:FkbM family methyltransferase
VTMLTKSGALVAQWLGRDSAVIRTLRPSYEWLLDAASGGRGTSWSVNDEIFRIDPRVRRLVAPTAEPELWAWLKENVRSGDAVLDVGAFLGIYAIVEARWSGPAGRVMAFEPTPSTVTTLRRHVRINDVAERITVMPVALGAAEGRVELHEHSDPYRNAVGATDPMGQGTGTKWIEQRTLDAVCREQSFTPTLMRMDVQGFERAILMGARNVIEAGRGRLRIVLEVHPQLWPLQGFGVPEFEATLAELGLRARALRQGGPLYEPDGHVALEYV